MTAIELLTYSNFIARQHAERYFKLWGEYNRVFGDCKRAVRGNCFKGRAFAKNSEHTIAGNT